MPFSKFLKSPEATETVKKLLEKVDPVYFFVFFLPGLLRNVRKCPTTPHKRQHFWAKCEICGNISFSTHSNCSLFFENSQMIAMAKAEKFKTKLKRPHPTICTDCLSRIDIPMNTSLLIQARPNYWRICPRSLSFCKDQNKAISELDSSHVREENFHL